MQQKALERMVLMYKKFNKQYIGGEWIEGNSDRVYVDQNPYNEETISEIRLANEKDIDKAYQAAKEAQKEWEQVNPYGPSKF